MRDLIGRPVSFRYWYNMRCEHCGRLTPLSASTYYREQCRSACIKCLHCPGDIHYGPYALALRDARDPGFGRSGNSGHRLVSHQHLFLVAAQRPADDADGGSRSSAEAPRATSLNMCASGTRTKHCTWGPTKPRSNRCSARCAIRTWLTSGSGSTELPCAAT